MAEREEKVFATFEKREDILKIQNFLLGRDLLQIEPIPYEEIKEEVMALQKFTELLDEYQEQPYLLDPYLEGLVAPVVERLKDFTIAFNADPTKYKSYFRAGNIASVLYSYIKFRGYKAIIRFFPHEIADLSIALSFMQIPTSVVRSPDQWHMRYVMLLWLYLICMIPFDLAQFDEPDSIGKTANDIESVAKSYIGKPGLERQGASLLLARLYMRKDTGPGFHNFVQWTLKSLREEADVLTAVGLLQVVCEVVKSGSAEQVQDELSDLLAISQVIHKSPILSGNTLVRKYATKLTSRVGLRLLPGAPSASRKNYKILSTGQTAGHVDLQPEGFDVPSDVEDILQTLFEALQYKDTVVRWSAAKGIGRIAERLPKDFANQVLEMLFGLFEIHSVAAATMYDLPAIAESTWHGASLACAEMARHNLIEASYLPQLIEWLSKALYFDLRKGAHSIGSNVRDAASYVLWALARTQDQSALANHSTFLAQRLAAVACFDREVHIRRAASAAFQEHVGRTNLLPHGIDVLGKTDFYAVSIQKNAFLTAAPQVAEHVEYRVAFFDHILDVVLRHWDIRMRELGSQSLKLICSHDLFVLAPRAIDKSVRLLDSLDTIDIHGGLSALCEIALAYRECIKDPLILDKHLRDVFKTLSHVPESTISSSRNEIIAEAACRLIAHAITVAEINLGDDCSVPGWKKIIDMGLKHRQPTVQEAAAQAMAVLSVSSDVINSLLDALLGGLTDYTIDERGDVGSWARLACVQGLAAIAEILLGNADSITGFEDYYPPEKHVLIAAGILKQGVERLDNVRLESGACFTKLLSLPPPQIGGAERWRLPATPLLEELFLSPTEQTGWNEGDWLYPCAFRLLEVPEYRQSVLSGLIISIGSKTDSIQKPVSKNLVAFSQSLPLTATSNPPYSLLEFLADLVNYAKSNMTSNPVVIPVFQTFNIMFEADVLEEIPNEPSGLQLLKTLLHMASKNIDKMKSVQRIQEATKIAINLLALKPIRDEKVSLLDNFLTHPFPRVRSDAAEYLYVLLQSRDLGIDTEEIEELLLETEWSTGDMSLSHKASNEIVRLLQST
ncbi:armadillo-type protein [Panaeolus papilionaceus]|nr:armadillo-type protein [Panaeolus papilionaceus]